MWKSPMWKSLLALALISGSAVSAAARNLEIYWIDAVRYEAAVCNEVTIRINRRQLVPRC